MQKVPGPSLGAEHGVSHLILTTTLWCKTIIRPTTPIGNRADK